MKNILVSFSLFIMFSFCCFSQNKELFDDSDLDSIFVQNPNFSDHDYLIHFYYDVLQYNPLFMPLVFDGKWLPDTLSLAKKDTLTMYNPFAAKDPFTTLQEEMFDWKSQELNNYIKQSAKNYVYKNAPDIVQYNMEMLPKVLPKEEEITTSLLKNLFKPEIDAQLDIGRVQRTYPKEVFWWKIVNNTFNISQAYFSENWHKGGESNVTILNIQNLKFGYNDKSTLEFETEIECKFSFYNTPQDTLRKLRVNDDVSFIKSKLGYKAFDNFYYTLSTEFKTQLFNNYKTNTRSRVTSFLSPGNLSINLGVDYKLNMTNVTLSAIISPFSYQWIYVKDKGVDPVSFGLSEGKRTMSSYGSKLSVDSTWAFNKQINWVSRLYYFTTYDRVETEWENTFNFVLNRYLTTKIIAHARFDDNVQKSDKFDYFQFKEMITFGISYRW